MRKYAFLLATLLTFGLAITVPAAAEATAGNTLTPQLACGIGSTQGHPGYEIYRYYSSPSASDNCNQCRIDAQQLGNEGNRVICEMNPFIPKDAILYWVCVTCLQHVADRPAEAPRASGRSDRRSPGAAG